MPASVANLGPGFDVLAMAVDLWLEVEAEESDEPEWEFEGEGADFLSGDAEDRQALGAGELLKRRRGYAECLGEGRGRAHGLGG